MMLYTISFVIFPFGAVCHKLQELRSLSSRLVKCKTMLKILRYCCFLHNRFPCCTGGSPPQH